MAVFLLLPRAKTDLLEIWGFIAEDSENRADSFIETISKKLSLLAEKPTIGRTRDELGENIRSFPIGRYIVFYQATADGINVVRILHAARDLETIFTTAEDVSP